MRGALSRVSQSETGGLVTASDILPDLDAVRALMTALSNRTNGVVTPVSIVALQNAVRGRVSSMELSAGLGVLREIRDIQALGRGFYVPVPSHLVPLGGLALIVASLPNQEVERLYGFRPVAPGSSRLALETRALKALPECALLDWLGTPVSTIRWTKDKLTRARFQEPIDLKAYEVFQS